jgi:hypothetical protein
VVNKWYKLAIIFVIVIMMSGATLVLAKSSDEIIFKDKNLEIALGKFYECEPPFTKEKANELSQIKDFLIINSADISDLEGLQYFDNLIGINLSSNELDNLSVLPKMKKLFQIVISYNSVKRNDFENILNNMGRINELNTIYLRNNEISSINFLNRIGNINKYLDIYMEENTINDISVLKYAVNLQTLDLSDNCITDVSALKDLKHLIYNLNLQDNCIIDYKPIKPILDKIYEDRGWDGVISRYDYYTNPVDIGVNGKNIKFPYLTAYYKYQAYVEAIPLFKALGGSAQYNKKTGTLTCEYDGDVLVIKDFEKNYTINGKQISMKYPMRRMQYDLAYVPVKNICKAFGLSYKVTKKRELSEREDVYFYAPKYINIIKVENELG